jgi:DNA-binding transcriptional MerR regulator
MMRSGSVLKPLLKIGELSKQTQVTVGVLRYYESLGLLLPAQRGNSGYRYYAAESVEQVGFIQKAQALGFSLPEVQHILGVRVIGAARKLVLKQLLDDKIATLNQEIQRLTAFKVDLESYQSHCTQQEIPKEEYVQGLLQLINRVNLTAIAALNQSA